MTAIPILAASAFGRGGFDIGLEGLHFGGDRFHFRRAFVGGDGGGARGRLALFIGRQEELGGRLLFRIGLIGQGGADLLRDVGRELAFSRAQGFEHARHAGEDLIDLFRLFGRQAGGVGRRLKRQGAGEGENETEHG